MQLTSSQMFNNQSPFQKIKLSPPQTKNITSQFAQGESANSNNQKMVMTEKKMNQFIQLDDKYENANKNDIKSSIKALKQRIQDQQKIFLKKELQLQELVLQEQQEFDKKFKFIKLQYQTKISDLKWELKLKEQQIESLNLQLSNFNLSKISEKLHLTQNSFSQNSNDIIKQSYLKLPQRSQKKEQQKYCFQKEVKRIRIQTAQFAEKFITEKNQIQQDLEELKSQKLMLKQLFFNKNINNNTERLLHQSISNVHQTIQRKQSSSFGMNNESQKQLEP